MRSWTNALIIVVLSGCAAAPPAKAPETTTKFVASGETQPDPKTLDEAMKLGYKVVNEQGKTMYCRESRQLGSHLKKNRECVTEEDLAAARDANQRNFEGMKKNATIRQGLEGGRGG